MVFHQLDRANENSMTLTGQCKLYPLVLAVQDSCQLYDYLVKVLFKLHKVLKCIFMKQAIFFKFSIVEEIDYEIMAMMACMIKCYFFFVNVFINETFLVSKASDGIVCVIQLFLLTPLEI
ncbi:HIP1R [Bugula neritina]|uniref:HIP1R n=1 Tax=Bugula neritina TaxID=10212 RepID=A0A7J7JBV4_BUGNE|nr:HIP1R [Bugula neritina]